MGYLANHRRRASPAYLAGIDSNNLFPLPKCVDGDGWSDNSSTTTNLSGNALGFFPGASVATNGQVWHRLQDAQVTNLVSGTDYFLRAFWGAGTSGEARIVLRNTVGGVESFVQGAFGSLSVSSTAAGIFSNIVEVQSGGVNIFEATFTPNASYDVVLGIGPNSSTSGETVIAYGVTMVQT